MKLTDLTIKRAKPKEKAYTLADGNGLTMTKFQMMLKAKFPDEKGFTREEYDAVIEADDKRTRDLLSGKRRLVSMK